MNIWKKFEVLQDAYFEVVINKDQLEGLEGISENIRANDDSSLDEAKLFITTYSQSGLVILASQRLNQ